MKYFIAFLFVFVSFFGPQATYAITKSKAEGVDRTAAAKATSWVGTVIGINDGEKSLVLTEATKLDHIVGYQQRSAHLAGASISKNGDDIGFSGVNIGDRVRVYGSYNATKRIITASRMEVGITAAAPAAAERVASVSASGAARNLSSGMKGADVVEVQQFLIKKGFLVVPKGTKLGSFGAATVAAVKKYQKSVRVSQTGTVGPQTRAKMGL